MEIETIHWGNHLISLSLFLADLTIRIGLSIRVIMRKRSHGVTFAWLIIILLVPFLGAVFYLLFGENRIGDKRAAKARESLAHYHQWLNTLKNREAIDWQSLSPECQPIHIQADNLIGIPTLAGNKLELFKTTGDIIEAIINDINQAQSTCHLQFYIWQEGGVIDLLTQSLIDAAKRKVTCRVLLDSIGSKEFLGSETCKKMRAAGIKVTESLPAGLIKAFFVRLDIRNHRKIVVIDGKIAYTGSQNMVDPDHFKQNQGVGKWIDLMARIQGPAVECLGGTFISDWFLDTDRDQPKSRSLEEDIEHIRKIADIYPTNDQGHVAVQVVPSGPGFNPEAIHSLLLTTIYAARKEIVLTTPYFVPDESLLTALFSAAQRGVDVRIIMPEKNDSRLVHFASRAHLKELLSNGVKIFLFQGGLLHPKTITVDQEFSLFGSVNLDMRSFWLNFETTLFIYNSSFTKILRGVQKDYEHQSILLAVGYDKKKAWLVKFQENTALLLGPLL